MQINVRKVAELENFTITERVQEFLFKLNEFAEMMYQRGVDGKPWEEPFYLENDRKEEEK